jgi:hypothetical protein
MKTDRHERLLERLSAVSPNSRNVSRAGIVPSESLAEYRSFDEFGIQKVTSTFNTFSF